MSLTAWPRLSSLRAQWCALGVYDAEEGLRYAGSVGTGWSTVAGAEMWRQLRAVEIKTSPFAAEHSPTKGKWSKRVTGSERWSSPSLLPR